MNTHVKKVITVIYIPRLFKLQRCGDHITSINIVNHTSQKDDLFQRSKKDQRCITSKRITEQSCEFRISSGYMRTILSQCINTFSQRTQRKIDKFGLLGCVTFTPCNKLWNYELVDNKLVQEMSKKYSSICICITARIQPKTYMMERNLMQVIFIILRGTF